MRTEWFPLVNEEGETIGKATRKECHSGSKLLHPVIHLHTVSYTHLDVYKRQVLYRPDVIKYTRILPRFYFVAGGIEVDVYKRQVYTLVYRI